MNKQEAIEEVTELFGDSIQAKAFRNIIRKLHEPQKVVVSQVAVEYYYKFKDYGYSLVELLGDFCYQSTREKFPRLNELETWLYGNDEATNRQRELALATLIVNGPDAVEIEQEQLYVVTDGNKLYLKEFDELNAVIIIDDVVGAIDYAKRYSDKTAAQKAADELGWVVKEVE
ncbi:hypothetical protein [Streptococcus suis]|uniref:hypothetical protein n=1 Tax=Streptococcus suis TaxID=1307 RepID=UPI0004055FF2|nr:hypothetical protein [Streptococcus suis]